jgi:hypothetical protein
MAAPRERRGKTYSAGAPAFRCERREQAGDDQEQDRQAHHQGPRRRDRRAQLLAQEREDCKRQGALGGVGEELRDDHLVEGGHEGEVAGEDAGQDQRRHDAKEADGRLDSENGGRAHEIAIEAGQARADRHRDEGATKPSRRRLVR